MPIFILCLLFGVAYYWPVDFRNYLGKGASVWKIWAIIFALPFFEGLVQGGYACYLQKYTDYFERQERYRVAGLKLKAEMAIKRATYGRWWWMKKYKK